MFAHNSNPIFENYRLTSSNAAANDIVDGDRLNVDNSLDAKDLSRTFNNKFPEIIRGFLKEIY